jgi:hypothetical protein
MHTEETVHTQETLVMWECCHERTGEPFDSTGLMFETKAEALKHLRECRERRPDTYLVKVVMTRCSPEEEQLEVGLA